MQADEGHLIALVAGKPVLVAGGTGDQDSPAVSPDGALVAYQSLESGQAEFYVALLRRIGDLPPLGPATVTDDPTILGRQRALAAVDDGVGSILEALKATGQLDNTVVVFAGDNGYFYGEHGLSEERRLA